MTHDQAEILIAELPTLTTSELREQWAALFGTHCYSHSKTFLIRRITWRLRNELQGGLNERAQTRAELIADEALIRLRPPKYSYVKSEARPLIRKEYKGTIHEVIPMSEGRYAYKGEIFSNLTAIAWKIAGYKTSGNKFFNLPAKARQ